MKLSFLFYEPISDLAELSRRMERLAAMGYQGVRRLFGVELPLAAPVIAAGLRVAAVSNVSIVSVATLIGVSQLGDLLVDGYNRVIWGELLTGIIACVLLVLTAKVLRRLLLRPEDYYER